MMHERDFEFLDLVVGMFAGTSKELIVKAASTEKLEDIFYGSLLAVCILDFEKLEVKEGRALAGVSLWWYAVYGVSKSSRLVIAWIV